MMVTNILSFSHNVLSSVLTKPRPHCSVGGAQDFRTGGRWCDSRLGQYSFPWLMVFIASGFIRLSPLSVVLTKVMYESSQWLGKNIVWITGKRDSRKACMGRCTGCTNMIEILLKMALNNMQSIYQFGQG